MTDRQLQISNSGDYWCSEF